MSQAESADAISRGEVPEAGQGVVPATPAIDPRRYFESRQRRGRAAESPPGLPLSRDHQPLQSVVHDLPAYL